MKETAEPSVQSEEEAAAWAMMATWDSRLTELETRIDRLLARMGVEV